MCQVFPSGSGDLSRQKCKYCLQLYQQQISTRDNGNILIRKAHWHDPVNMAWVSFKKILDFNNKFELRKKNFLESASIYLGNIDKFDDDVSPLLGGSFTEHHTLDPLGESIKKSNGTLQLGIVLNGP